MPDNNQSVADIESTVAEKCGQVADNVNPVADHTAQVAPSAPKHKVTPARQGVKKTSIGGQALIEGLMMVGPKRISMAIRKADGSIYVEEISQGRKMIFFEKVPFFRGGIRLFRQLVTGTGALMKSAELSEETPPAPVVLPSDTQIPDAPHTDTQIPDAPHTDTQIPDAPHTDTQIPDAPHTDTHPLENRTATSGSAGSEEVRLSQLAKEARTAANPPKMQAKPGRIDLFLEKNMNLMIVIFAFLGIMFSITLFILLPRLIVDFSTQWIPDSKSSALSIVLSRNLAEGLLRILIFVGYLMLTSRLKDIARVWMYHGAEHKTIACFESGEPLTVENIRKFSRFHPRCGTAFLFVVVIVSILVFSVVGAFIGVNIWWLNILIRLALMPFVAGIAYEIIHFTGKHDKNPICRSVSKPGLWMQRFTTKEPDDRMLEVAIAAVLAVLPENEGEDTW